MQLGLVGGHEALTTFNLEVLNDPSAVVNPGVLKGRGERQCISHRHLSQMHTTNYAFYTGKGGLAYISKKIPANRGRPPPPTPPLNPPVPGPPLP